MPYYTYATSTSSANTYLIYPQWTTTGATVTWANGNAPYRWQITTGEYAPDPGWSWGWNQPPAPLPQYQPPSREELDQMAAEERHRTEERQAARARIAGRAEALLASLLDEDQFRSYLRHGWFDVTGSAGGRYRINRNGQAGNVDELAAEGDHRVASLCIHPYGGYPDADAHAAQYLALVTNEPGFRRTANRTPRRRLQAAA